MANKYIVHGAAFCGDGTSPDLATSNGGVGAWNDINIFENTAPPYGTLSPGDVVYIRPKDADNQDITRTLTASISLGSSVATEESPIKWVIDNNGDVWSGVTGTVTYIYFATTAYALTFLVNNWIIASVQDGLVVKSLHVSGTDAQYVFCNGLCKNVLMDLSAQTHATNNYASPFTLGKNATAINLHYRRYRLNSSNNSCLRLAATGGTYNFINPQIEVLVPSSGYQPCFSTFSQYSQSLNVLGGRLYGPGVTSSSSVLYTDNTTENTNALALLRGFQYPKTVNLFSVLPKGHRSIIDVVACDGGAGGHFETGWGSLSSRSDNNPPVLSSELPDGSNTRWSWRMYPRDTLPTYPARHQYCVYSQSATGQKTITLEFLAEETFAPNKSNTWIDVAYTNADGVGVVESARDLIGSAPCDSSTAQWSSTTWGAATFNRYKLQLTTSDSVKQGTAVVVTFYTTLKSTNNLQVLFLNGEVSIL